MGEVLSNSSLVSQCNIDSSLVVLGRPTVFFSHLLWQVKLVWKFFLRHFAYMVKPSKLISSIWSCSSSIDILISRDVHLFSSITPLVFLRNLILDACTCDHTLLVITKFLQPYRDRVGEKGQRLFQKLRGLLFLDNSCLATTELCKALFIAIALPIRISSSSSCLPSLVIAIPRYLNLYTYFSVAPFSCNKH